MLFGFVLVTYTSRREREDASKYLHTTHNSNTSHKEGWFLENYFYFSNMNEWGNIHN